MIRILLSTRLGERRWTQADLARKTGIRAATICHYYNELVDSISLNHLDKLCSVLGCQPGDLISYDASVPHEDQKQKRKGKKVEPESK